MLLLEEETYKIIGACMKVHKHSETVSLNLFTRKPWKRNLKLKTLSLKGKKN
jgi:hypothetical protein